MDKLKTFVQSDTGQSLSFLLGGVLVLLAWGKVVTHLYKEGGD